jgi:hypothetical protein
MGGRLHLGITEIYLLHGCKEQAMVIHALNEDTMEQIRCRYRLLTATGRLFHSGVITPKKEQGLQNQVIRDIQLI